jgi:hypothetical protein
VLGLLYGDRDPDKTIIIATRGGQDSDCNPSSAAGILFTSLGLENLPAKYTEKLDLETKFTHTDYTFAELLEVCEKLGRDAILRAGGKIVREGNQEILLIKHEEPRLRPLEQSWAPGPIANSKYTPEEMVEKIRPDELTDGRTDMKPVVESFAKGWHVEDCGLEMDPGIRADYKGRQRVLLTHPDDGETPCVLWREIAVPANGKASLSTTVSHHDGGDWDLVVRIDGKEVLTQPVGIETVKDGWLTVDVPLADYAGKTVKIELLNKPSGWFCEAAYWAEIKLSGV